ncbi:MAG: hypothetical protein HN458_03850 [Euryarchaeota archaeon]|jgi:hypothetical protein|nr:hypothetical protein [Euryarchaeota archaeon]
MKSQWSIPILLVMTIVLGSSSGCLGLLQSREFLENGRDAPKLDTETISYKEIKVFVNPFEWEAYTNTTFIPIDDPVSEISIYRKVQITGTEDIGCFESFTRYVRAELYTPSNNLAWSIDVCQDLGASTDPLMMEEDSTTFENGNWRLEINARGGGLQNTALQDNFEINVIVTRTCLMYPLEDGCE